MKTQWTLKDIQLFRTWHEKRMLELNYSDKVREKLRQDREKWIPFPWRNK